MPPPPIDPNAVFLNIPYDEQFQSLYVAYIVGLYQLGLVPHIASEIPGGRRRLDKILILIQSCRYSIHDLSRIEVSGGASSTPRFNMPLELGIAVAWESFQPDVHTWSVWESERYRLLRSTSDLNGSDPYIHEGKAEGVLRELRNAFWREDAPSVNRMMEVYRFVFNCLDPILSRNKTPSSYDRSVFMELCRLVSSITQLLRMKKRVAEES
jgi:hypothetical protein